MGRSRRTSARDPRLLPHVRAARIPFTLFAVPGGALAIGAGFGTLNPISGLINLLERKIRGGDNVTIVRKSLTGRTSGLQRAAGLRQHCRPPR